MKVRVMVPTSDEDYIEYELNADSVPRIGEGITMKDHIGLNLEVDHIIYIQEHDLLVPTLFLKDDAPAQSVYSKRGIRRV